MKKQRILYFIILIILLLYLILNTKNAVNAIKDGAILFFNGVLPSLFPFLVISNMFFKLDYAKYMAKIFSPFMTKFFKTSGIGAYPLITSIICGYPIGSKSVCDMYLNNKLTKQQASKLISICSTPGPIFVIGTVCSIFLNVPSSAVIILISIYSALFIYAKIFFKYDKETKKNISHSNYKKHYNIGKIFSDSITNSLNTLLSVMGYIMFFSLVINLIDNTIFFSEHLPFKLHIFLSAFIKGLIEMTNGIQELSTINIIPLPLIISSITFLLSFGGFCANMQCISFIVNTDLNVLKYIISKIILGSISAIISYILSFIFLRGEITTFAINNFLPFSYSITSVFFFCIVYTFIIAVSAMILKKEI